ncbi:Actinidain protein [Dioscorea alata]|uniref:Actinidain protein n=1 Tax=Dioscorea alata TaxID=55571 RepID=A0ACB7VDY1_DIOAL|nr:Actinidain protein [Dioscorea alata]
MAPLRLLLLLALLSLSSSSTIPSRSESEIRGLYERWLAEHGKSSNSLDDQRYEIFKDNLRFIDEHNAGNHSFVLGLNRFADLTNDEYRSTYLGLRRSRSNRIPKVSDRYRFNAGDELPDSIDWRELGAVAPVKDQGSCGSCWAFSTIAAVEGINKIVTGDMIVLSEQELVDCDTTYNMGCSGGLMDYAFEFIINNGGIDTEDDYPYNGLDGYCDPNRRNAKVVSIDSYEDVPVNSESALKKACASQPVSVAIEGGGRLFQLYQSGVFTGTCGTDLDHGVTAVGYGTEKGKDYWLVRNSWGKNWGEDGYVKMERNIKSPFGKCGIAIEPSYPIKEGPNPPNPGPSPPSPVKPESVCDNYYSCPASSTCCCVYDFGKLCIAWGCCPLEGATCCEDHYSCCPADYPICNLKAGTCVMSKGNPLGVKALARTPAKPHRSYSEAEGKRASE